MNVDLEITLINLLDLTSKIQGWIEVPSHADTPGDEQANRLAERGCLCILQYSTRQHFLEPLWPALLQRGGGHSFSFH